MRQTCPHCNRANSPLQHVNACAMRPGVRELVQDLAAGDEPGTAVSKDVYIERFSAHNAAPGIGLRAPSYDMLKTQFGGWPEVCEWVGLRMQRKKMTRSVPSAEIIEAVMDETSVTLAETAAILAYERTYGDEIPHCDYHFDSNGRKVDGPRRLRDGRFAWTLK